MNLKAFFILALFGIAFAQTAQFTCETYYTLNPQVFNAGYSQGQFIGSCAGDTWRWNNIDFTMVQKFGSVQPVTITQNATGAFIWTAFPDGTNQLVSRVDVNYIGDIVNGTSILLIGPNAGTTNATANGVPVAKPTESKYLTFIVYNSTTYNMTSDYGSFLLNKGDNLTMNAMSFSIPLLNVSKLTEFHLARDHSAPGTFSPTVTITPYGWKLSDEASPFMNVSAFTYNGTGIISKGWGAGLSGFTTIPENGWINATLVGSSVIKPLVNFYSILQRSYVTQYSNSTLVTHINNNQNLITYDGNTGVWYFCPALLVTNFTPIYTITCIPNPVSGATFFNASMIFLINNCFQNGDNYTWFIKAPTTTSFQTQLVLNNSTIVNTAFSGTIFSGSQQVQNFPNGAYALNFTISAGSTIACQYQNGTSLFFGAMPSVIGNFQLTKILAGLMFVVAAALTTVTPFAGLFLMFINDVVPLMPLSEVFVVFVFASIISMVMNYRGNEAFKSIALYLAIGLAMLTNLVFIGTSTGIPSSNFPSLTALGDALSGMQAALNNTNIGSFIVNSILFITNFGVTILTLPIIISNLLFGTLYYIHPLLYSAAYPFQNIFSIGMYVWIGMKLYEIATRQFPGII